MSRIGDLGNALYRGKVQYDFVGKRRRWYAISALIVLVCAGSLALRGLQFGVEFTGGAVFQVTAPGVGVDQARTAMDEAGVPEAVVQQLNNDRLRIQTPNLSKEERDKVVTTLSKDLKVAEDVIAVQFVGPSWGAEITKKAVVGLILFLILVVVFLSIYFEFKMAVAALVALVHDVLITVGVYSLFAIEVTPATVIGVLTILGYSLYDTVVVFDKVRENTAGIATTGRMTYSDAANLAVNQTLVRSINTSLVALLPVIAILVGAVGLLGAGTLLELGVALLVGIAAGTYSSIFIATPLLADLKEREPKMVALAKRVENRRSSGREPAVATASTATSSGPAATASGATASGQRQQPSRKKKRR
ncbi:MAG TPA: protein translocase subunit SecF [Actinobacteria bacterium]|nr:protein translocase subunit SecF [Actinomycetota bacterium]HCK79584.1 protein translocase subunit SecF [Actinomycetota bacterium]